MSRSPRHTLLLLPLLLAACGDNAKNQDPDSGPEQVIQYDREVSVPQLDGTVSAFYDGQGVLSLQCTTDADCLATQGYFHAADRFFQMDLRRRLAQGKLSELAGPLVLQTDITQRTLLSTRDGGAIAEQMLASLSPEVKKALDDYSRGVNAWIDDLRNERNGAKLSAEYDFMIIDKTIITDWTPLDSIACFLPIINTLTNDSPKDLLSAEALADLGVDMGTDLFGVATVTGSAVIPFTPPASTASNVARPMDMSNLATIIRAARKVVGDGKEAEEIGSNNWIVSASKGGGKTFMADDPHLALSNPALWYMIHIDSKTKGTGELHLSGASFAGVPGILLGQNEAVAWGATTTRFDQADVYVETLNKAGDAVIFNGVEVKIEKVDHEFVVNGAANAMRTIQYVPHHGPILSIDTVAGTALSLRWSAQDADTDFNFLWKMWTAKTLAEGKSAIEEVTSLGQNFVVADLNGDIGWYPYNRVPKRPWAATIPSWHPIPGGGTAEWGDYVPYSELPQSTNPSEGFLATANNDMTGHLYDGDPSTGGNEAIQNHAFAGFRHQRIVELLDEKDDLTIEDMQRIQHDTKSLYGANVTPSLLSDAQTLGPLSANAQKVLALLQNWDFFCPSGYQNTDVDNPVESTDAAVLASARGCAAFHVVWARLREATFNDEIAAAGSNLEPDDEPMAMAFMRPEQLSQSYWDDVSTAGVVETRAEIVGKALEAAATHLDSKLGSDADKWLWGALHNLYMPADLFDAAGVPDFAHGPFINDGALGTVNVASPIDDLKNNYNNSNGASFRLTCELDEAITCFYQLPGGQKHHRADNFYNNLLDGWLKHVSTRLPFSIDDVIGVSVDTIKVQ